MNLYENKTSAEIFGASEESPRFFLHIYTKSAEKSSHEFVQSAENK